MKNIKLILALTFLTLLWGCSDGDRIVDQVLDETTSGGILRTLSTNNGTFDFNDPSIGWSITVEAQDEQDGGLLQSVNVYAGLYRSAALIGTEEFIKEIPASAFTEGDNGFPVGDITATLSEVAGSLGLSPADYSSTDEFRIRLEYVMTNGQTWSRTDAAGTVLTSSYFRSPYLYTVPFFCALENASIFDGDYTVTTDSWADYTVGDVVPVVYNPDDGPYTFRILATNNPFLVNADSAYMIVTVDPSDGSVVVSANEDFDYGDNFVVTVTGDGTVATCTGNINLSVDFGPNFTNNTFRLTKN
ncbi:MAG: hypothetical protein WA951_04770 [Leeuwenhoekiella sp.]